MLTINLLQALPKTPLWDRLKLAGRLEDDPTLESNVRFLRPYQEVVVDVAPLYRPCQRSGAAVRRAFYHQVDATYANRIVPPARGKLNWGTLSGALVMAFRVVLHIGILVGLPQAVLAGRAPRGCGAGRSDAALGMAFIAHHLIQFHARGAPRRAERVVLLDQGARGRARAFRRNWRVAQVGVGINHIRVFVIAGLGPGKSIIFAKRDGPPGQARG